MEIGIFFVFLVLLLKSSYFDCSSDELDDPESFSSLFGVGNHHGFIYHFGLLSLSSENEFGDWWIMISSRK